MQSFQTWLATTPLGAWAKTFAAVVISAAVADWVTHGVISLASWQTWVIAAAGSIVAPVVNYLNPQDTRYGRGSTAE